MSFQFNKNKLSRSISVADYILEDSGHSVAEAAEEFSCSTSTIRRDIDFLGVIAFYSTEDNLLSYNIDEIDLKVLKVKYLKVQKTLKRITKEHNANNIGKWNTRNATSN